MTKKEFLKSILGDEYDDAESIAWRIKSFLDDPNVDPKIKEKINWDGDISLNEEFEPEFAGYSYIQYIVGKMLAACHVEQIIHYAFDDIDPELCSEWDDYFDYTNKVSEAYPLMSEIRKAFTDFAETVNWEEGSSDSFAGAKDLLEKFDSQIKEKGIEADTDMRNLLLLDFYNQYKSGNANPVIGDGIK